MISIGLSLMIAAGVQDVHARLLDDLKNRDQPAYTEFYDRKGKQLGRLRHDASKRVLEWTRLDSIAKPLIEAVVVSEDRRFFSHAGVDYLGLIRASVRSLTGDRLEGGSTLSMQLASRLSNGTWKRKGRRDIWEKLDQLSDGHSLEEHMTKDEILEAYLNLVPFRSDVLGVNAAAKVFFGKAPSQLDRIESLILAVQIRSPQSSLAQVRARACVLGREIFPDVECARIEAKPVLNATSRESDPGLAQVSTLRFLKSGAASEAKRIDTTLDRDLDVFARERLQEQVKKLSEQNVREAAVIVVHWPTSEIRAYSSFTLDPEARGQIDGVQTRRQVGSVLKPLLYGLSLEKKIYTVATPLLDEPFEAVKEGRIYAPENYDKKYRSEPVPLRVALGSSLNVPAVRVLDRLGVGEYSQLLRRLGFQVNSDPEYYGLSLALGTLDASLFEITRSFAGLARGGVDRSLIFQKGQKPKFGAGRFFSPETSYLLASVLSDTSARRLSFGWESPLQTSSFSAVKTGTSKDMRDNWCVGFSDEYVVGVWVGNYTGQPMWDVSGISGAAPAWRSIMEWLHRKRPSQLRSTRGLKLVERDGEWYRTGTEPVGPASEIASQATRISYPINGMVVAWDPEIPEENQKIILRTTNDRSVHWWLGDQELSGPDLSLKEVRGAQKLEIRDEKGERLDTVSFYVKGAAPSSAVQR